MIYCKHWKTRAQTKPDQGHSHSNMILFIHNLVHMLQLISKKFHQMPGLRPHAWNLEFAKWRRCVHFLLYIAWLCGPGYNGGSAHVLRTLKSKLWSQRQMFLLLDVLSDVFFLPWLPGRLCLQRTFHFPPTPQYMMYKLQYFLFIMYHMMCILSWCRAYVVQTVRYVLHTASRWC